MALFKPFKGNRANLDSVTKHEGHAYFCVDDGTFHIDYADGNGNIQRKSISVEVDSTTLNSMLREVLV